MAEIDQTKYVVVGGLLPLGEAEEVGHGLAVGQARILVPQFVEVGVEESFEGSWSL